MPAPPTELTPTRPPIVAPPEERPGPAPENAYRSDRDNRALREQLKRGDSPDAGAIGGPTTRAPANRAPVPPRQRSETTQTNPPRPLQHLALDEDTVRHTFGARPTPTPATDLAAAIMGGTEVSGGYRAFSRPRGAGAAVLGSRGSNDYLPNLPDGDLTLLNTKANRFAVFVRRVATQVFAQLRRSGWENLTPADIEQIRDLTTVSAVLSPRGELLRATIETSSGSPRFDTVVLDAIRRGARDPHPPAGAEAPDGNIHFIFQSRSWVRFAPDPRGPGFGERRWILLGTGLD